MGFEDDMDYKDDFETDITDPDSEEFGEKPKKMSRKDFRRAKKKTVDKIGDSIKPKRGLFNRRSSKSDDDDEDMADDMFNSSSNNDYDNEDYDSGSSIKSSHSEFGYLFEPPREGESEDDVYPDSSIYSDSSAAKDMLGGLAYDGSDDGDSSGFDKYFDNPDQTRPPSQFSFNKRDDDFSLPGSLNTPVGSAPSTPAPITVDSSAASAEEKPDSYLPDLRADSVFISRDDRQPTPTKSAADSPVQTQSSSEENNSSTESPAKDDGLTSTESVTQEFLPYGGMYPSYPMAPMMNYPMVMPGNVQAQGAQYQAIPIPYPMPMPMPMYNQYPQYIPQPQYVVVPQMQPQPQSQPRPSVPQYGGGDDYGRQVRRDDYDDRYDDRFDDGYDDRRSRRSRHRDDRYYDDRRDYRRGSEYDNRYNERSSARYYDERRGRYERRSDRYYDRIDARSYSDGQRAERKTYPKAPYEPPYPRQEPMMEPSVKDVPEPIKTESNVAQADLSAIIDNKPMNTPPAPQPQSPPPQKNNNLMSGFDAAFDSPLTEGFGFDANSFGMNSFGSDIFDPGETHSQDDAGFDEFSGSTPSETKFNKH